MKLSDVQSTMARLLDGSLSPEEASRILGTPAERLRAYSRGAAGARRTAIASVFPAGTAAIRRELGPAVWDELVATYFRAYPMQGFDRRAGADSWPAFVASQAGIPVWCAELVDLEWMEWCVETKELDAPASGAASQVTSARVNPTLVLRDYKHDLIDWLDSSQDGAPAPVGCVIAFWQDAQGDAFRNRVSETLLEALDDVRCNRPARDPDLLAELIGAELVLASGADLGRPG
jgi:hypothetical protein